MRSKRWRPSRGARERLDGEGLAKLLLDRLESEGAWRSATDALRLARPNLVASAQRHLSEEDLLSLLSALVLYVSQIGFETPARKAQLFDLAQALGAHILPVHYSSPVPDTRALPVGLSERPRDFGEALELDVPRQLEFLQRLSPWPRELMDVPLEAESGFFWNNTQLYRTDAAVYYAMIRELRPKRVVEVGGGYSTMLAARACVANGATDLVCIEPEPRPELRAGLAGLRTLIEQPVQDVDSALFAELRTGDILFIDGSHVSRVGSDVNHLLLGIVPRLAPGVVVHVHDVFTPWDYPEHWIREQQIFWNEQYLLEAFLLFNREFEPLCFMNLLGKTAPEAFRDALGLPPDSPAGGSSVWLRRSD